MPKYCSFCGQHNTPTNDEHVIPKWMARLYPDITWAIENQLTGYVRPSKKYVHLTVRFCEPCNGGWMKNLEDETIPILTPLIEGRRVILSPEDQAVIKTWFCLRAMVYDLHAAKRAPRPRYFKDEEHYELATTRNCYPYYEFYLARYKGSRLGFLREDSFDTSFIRLNPNQFEGNITRGYSMTLAFKYLVLQILCIKSPEPLTHMMPDVRAHRFQFGEPFAINSYPPFALTDNIIDDFVEFWSKHMKVPPHLIPKTP